VCWLVFSLFLLSKFFVYSLVDLFLLLFEFCFLFLFLFLFFFVFFGNMCYIIDSSKIEMFRSAGKLLKQKGLTQNASGSS